MSLKTISLISLIILALVFVFSLIDLYSFLQMDSEYVTVFDKVGNIVHVLLWIPFLLFFWKIYKG